METRDLPSANFDLRPAGRAVDMLLLHYTGTPSAASALERLRDAAAKVSAHYVVDEDGTVFRLVREEHRAWHAGVASWAGATDINARSIGIELVNPGHEWGYRPFPEAQMISLVGLARAILGRHPIPAERVLAHSDVAPSRRRDPGELFDWRRLAADGIGVVADAAPPSGAAATLAPGDSGPEIRALRAKLASFGYGVGVGAAYDGLTETVVRAFQRHYRPAAVDGRADRATLATLDDLLRRRPAPG